MTCSKLTAAVAAGVFLGLVAFDVFQRLIAETGYPLAIGVGLLVGVPAWALTIGLRAAAETPAAAEEQP